MTNELIGYLVTITDEDSNLIKEYGVIIK